MSKSADKTELTIIWELCYSSSMEHCQQVHLHQYRADHWKKVWEAMPGVEGWPYSHTEAHFVGKGMDTITVQSSSWPAQPIPSFPQDPKSRIFREANAGPHRWFTDTWQRRGDRYALVQHQVQPSAYNTLVEFIYALQTGGDATAWVTDAALVARARQFNLHLLPEQTLLCIEPWPEAQTTGPISIGECKEAVKVTFIAIDGQYLIERIDPK